MSARAIVVTCQSASAASAAATAFAAGIPRASVAVLLFGAAVLGSVWGADDDATFFTKSVQPVLVANCIRCHGADKQKARLRLDSREAILAGGKSGPAAVPGKPDDSLIVKAINYGDDDLQMPPKEKLSDADIKTLVDWIARGLPWNPAAAGAAAPAPGAPDAPKAP